MIDSNIHNVNRYQYLPPFKDEKELEEFMVSLFNELDGTNSYDRFGRKGQKQYGLDIYSLEKKTVIQCKLKIIGRPANVVQKELYEDLENDFNSFIEYNNSIGNKYNRFLFATTWYDDEAISTRCSEYHSDIVEVGYWSWDSIMRKIPNKVRDQYYPDLLKFQQDRWKSENRPGDEPKNEEKKSNVRFEISHPFLDHFYDFLESIYKEINFRSIYDLTRRLPSTSQKSHYPYYSMFTLVTDSQDFFDFFNSLIINKDGSIQFTENKWIVGIENYEQKTKEILSKLTSNLIFAIRNDSNNKIKEIRYHSHLNCDCIRCNFIKFDLYKAFKKRNLQLETIEDRFRQAYYHYKLGDYVGAANSFIRLSDETKDTFPVRHFIAQINLTQLRSFIAFRYYGKNNQDQLIKIIDQINTDQLFSSLSSSDEINFIRNVYSKEFLSRSLDAINNKCEEIIQHYYNQLNGGFSSNNHGWELINEYLQLHSFLSLNYIIYDDFREFKDLTQKFIEGLIASHAIDENQPGRVEIFDDYLMRIIILHGNVDKIKNYINRYKLDKIKYQNSAGESSVFTWFNSFLSNQKKLVKYISKDNYPGFQEKYGTYFSNFLFLFGMMEMPKKQVKLLLDQIINILHDEHIIYPVHTRRLRFFVDRKGKQIDDITIKKLFFLSIRADIKVNENLLDIITLQIMKYHPSIQFSDSQKIIILQHLAVVEQNIENHIQLDYLLYLGSVLKTTDLFKPIRKIIIKKLNLSFDSHLYYMGCIYEVINYQDWFQKFREVSKPRLDRPGFKAFFGGQDDNRYIRLDQFFDLCFKYDIETTQFNELRGIDPYYDWLLDMGDFEYAKFDPKWLNGQTVHCFKQIQKHPKIKSHLKKYLLGENDKEISRIYFDLYERDLDNMNV